MSSGFAKKKPLMQVVMKPKLDRRQASEAKAHVLANGFVFMLTQRVYIQTSPNFSTALAMRLVDKLRTENWYGDIIANETRVRNDSSIIQTTS